MDTFSTCVWVSAGLALAVCLVRVVLRAWKLRWGVAFRSRQYGRRVCRNTSRQAETNKPAPRWSPRRHYRRRIPPYD